MNQGIKSSSIAIATLLLSTMANAAEQAPKQALKSNYQLIYSTSPAAADSFTQMFKEGTFYGRLRSNTFLYDWEKEKESQQNHVTSGLGGSLVYQSAIFNDFDFRAGLYYSHAYTSLSADDAGLMKAGSDVMSRFDYTNTGTKDLAALGQAYIRYSGIKESELIVGRQIVETFYTKSNDTKMIPNTFDGVVFSTRLIPKTSMSVGYLVSEKLRGHSDAHSVLVYGDANSSLSLNPAWGENDDSAMHKGLSYTSLNAAGKEDAPLIVVDAHNTSIENLNIDAAYYNVPGLISQAMLEGNYKVAFNEELSIAPGLRYIKQFDNGAGAIGGAAYDGTATGYKDPTSLDSQMLAARLVTRYQKFKLNLGYSQVFDEADLVTPWRGFPTAGYTRSMARYNWIANTKSYRAELMINESKTGVYRDVMMQISVLHTDADEGKGQYDENFYYAGFVQNLPIMPELQWRFRLGYQDTEKVDADGADVRFELNYLF